MGSGTVEGGGEGESPGVGAGTGGGCLRGGELIVRVVGGDGVDGAQSSLLAVIVLARRGVGGGA